MRFKQRHLMLGLTTAAAPLVIVVAPPALADCLDTGGVTVCSQSTVRAAGGEVSAGPEIPYDCPYDWYCEAFGPDSDTVIGRTPRVTPGPNLASPTVLAPPAPTEEPG